MEQWRGYAVKVERVSVGGRVYELLAPGDMDALLCDPGVESRFEQTEYMPYWATIWPAALALANEVATWPALAGEEPGPAVLELGCGLGLVALVAASRGYRVTASDYDEDALAFTEENARRNSVSGVATRCVDWARSYDDLRPERIVAADVLYETRNLRPVAEFIRRHLGPAGVALISDPNRATADEFAEVAGALGLVVDMKPAARVNEVGVPIPMRIYHLQHAARAV